MQWLTIVRVLSLVALINQYILADEIIVNVHMLNARVHEQTSACDHAHIMQTNDPCLLLLNDVDEQSAARTRSKTNHYAKKAIILLETSDLDSNGHLTAESTKMLLARAYCEGKLTNPAFQDSQCLHVTDIKHAQHGKYTEQLFMIESTCGNPEQFILKGIVDNEEIDALIKGSQHEDLAPIVYPNVQQGYPQIIFPIAYLSYLDHHQRKHSLSLMHVAPGKRLLSLMEQFAQSNDAQRATMHHIICQAYFETGAQMARFYKRYALGSPHLIPMGMRHGDFHPGNIFYDPATKRIALIDNDHIAKTIGRTENVCRDFVFLLVRTTPRMAMECHIYEEWFALSASSFIIGFLSVYPASEHIKIIEEIEKNIKNYEKNEFRRMCYQVGVVQQALHTMGQNIKACVYEGNVIKRLKAEIAKKSLAATDVDVNAKDRHGSTVLYEAIQKDSWLLWPLIAAGADVNVRDTNLNTPLHYAAQCNSSHAIAALFLAGADLHARSKNGKTPLDVAIQYKNKDAIKKLKELGAH